jgi:hypothetical protein
MRVSARMRDRQGRETMASMKAAGSTVRPMMTPWGVEEARMPPRPRRGHKTPHGGEAALEQVWDSPTLSRLILARMHPPRWRPCARSTGMSPPCCTGTHGYSNNHFL